MNILRILLLLNFIGFGIIGIIWSKVGMSNILFKFFFYCLSIANIIAFLYTAGYIIKIGNSMA